MDRLKAGGQFGLFGESYTFLKKWANGRLPLSDADWRQVVREADEIGERYKGGPLEALCCGLLSGAVGELERLSQTS